MTNNNSHTPSWEHDKLVHGWWVVPGRFLATEYPGHKTADKAQRKISVLIEAGVTSFVDLTEPGERTWDGSPMVPYEGFLPEDVTYRRFPIRDTSVLADDSYDEIVDHIQAELDAGKVVSVHCWGGKGRTGTVVGAFLIDTEGLGYIEVIDRMQELRAGSSKSDHPVPDTEEQHRVLRRRAQRNEAAE